MDENNETEVTGADQQRYTAVIGGAVRCRNGNLTISLGLVERERNEL